MTIAPPRRKRRTRAQRRADNLALFWQAKYEQSGSPARIAAVAWDRLRAEVEKLPADRRDAAWRQVTERVEEVRLGLAADHGP